MKKSLSFAIALLLILAFAVLAVACDGATVQTDPKTGEITITPAENTPPSQNGNEQTPSGEQGGNEQTPSGEQGGEQTQGDPSGEDPQGEPEGNEGEPAYVPTVTSMATLISRYPEQAKAFGDKVAQAILKKYNIENPIYCGYSYFDEDEFAQVSGMNVSVATKTDETERKFTTYKVVFDSVYLDDIADGDYTLAKTESAFVNEQTYNAKEKQNDTEFLANLYNQGDFSYVAYETETFEHTITIDELLANYSDTVNANLSTHYDNALKRVFAGRYSTRKDQVTNYQWDLGEVNENNEIQHAKLTFLWENNSSSTLYVCDVDFNSPISLNELSGNANVSASANYTPAYSFVYDNTLQGTRSELVNAILDKAITDGFDYQNAEIMFKENSAGTTSDLGSVRSFSIVVKGNSGIRQINATIQSSNTDDGLINKINQGKYTASCNTNISFVNTLSECSFNEAEMI